MVAPLTAEFLVFDTSSVSHMAKSQMLGILKILVDERTAVLTDVVEDEVRRGVAQLPALQAILDADWLVRHALSNSAEVRWYATFAQRLTGSGRNHGEASVLAWAKANGNATAVLDDRVARNVADAFAIPKIGTLRLLVDAVNAGLMAVALASGIADELLASGGRYAFKEGGFRAWAERQGLFTEG